MSRRLSDKEKQNIINAINSGLCVTDILKAFSVGSGTVYRIAEKNDLTISKGFKKSYSAKLLCKAKELLRKGYTKREVSNETGLSLEYLQNLRTGKHRVIKIKEDLEYLKSFLSEFSDVEAVKYQNIIRRTMKPLQENIVKVGLKKFKAQTVIDMIDNLTPHYYCDFWR